MQLDILLKQLGLNQKEANVYLALLQLGEAQVNELANNTEIPRTSIYTQINSLINKGAADYYKRKTRTYYVPVSPEKFLNIYKKNIKTFEEHLALFKKLEKIDTQKTAIKFVSGKEGINYIFDTILEEKNPILAISCIENLEQITKNYFEYFIEQRIRQNLPIKLLTNDSGESQRLKTTDAKSIRETRFVPQKYRFDTANYIFGNKVALLSLKQTPIMGVLIDDAPIANTHRMYFDLIWSLAK